nr:uncharacterized protein PB18E9.04c-like [Onthophagus taurus]
MSSNKPTSSTLRNGTTSTGKTVFNGITSTPISSQKTWMSNSSLSPLRLTPLRGPPRYSLSEAPNRPTSTPKPQSSPLTKSSKHNYSNLVAYTDAKSPGLSSRIVQYSNETRDNQTLTHQTRYGSPGIFPVVHFFKKDVPVISPKPKKVMVRLASPDVHWYNKTKFNKPNINETRNGHHTPQVNSSETETRSVLDALREISRKRIHTDSEFESTPEASCKRQKRTEPDNGTFETNKRAREDSPKSSDSSNAISPTSHQSKKICVVDVLAASFTSSQLFKEKMQNSLKRKSEVEIEKPIKLGAKRHTTLSNAETQTVNIEPKIIIQKVVDPRPSEVLPEKNIEIKSPDPKESDGKMEEDESSKQSIIFDENKLEVQRKNKLAVLLGVLTGEKTNIIQENDKNEQKSNDKESNHEQKLVGILSPMNKVKHDKHVHFNLTPEVKSISSSASIITEKINEKVKEETKKNNTNVSTGLISLKPEVTTQITTASLSTITTTTSTLASPIVTTMVTTTSVKSNEPINSNPITNLSFSFGTTPASNNMETPKKSTGGFKFNLTPPNTSAPISTTSTVKSSDSQPTFNFGASKLPMVSTPTPPPTFGVKEPAKSKENPPVFGNNKNDSSIPTFNLNTTIPQTTTSLSGFGTTNTQTSTTQSMFTFDGNTSFKTSQNANSVAPIFGLTPPSTFGTPTIENKSSGVSISTTFGKPISSSTASAPSFGITSGLPSTNPGAKTTQSMPIFGVTTTSTRFGTITTNATNKTTSIFGSNTTSTPTFSLNTSTTTGSTMPSTGFGTVVATPGFGTASAGNAITGFGATSSVFGTATTTSGFTATTVSSAFGTTSGFSTTTPTFGTSTSSAFGTPTTSDSKIASPPFNFGSTNNNNFGSPTLGGNGFGAPSTTAASFGTPSTNTTFGGFGQPVMTSSSFNATTSTSSTVFGGSGNNVHKFGNAPSTLQTFGNTNVTSGFPATSTAAPGFGNNNTFGTVSQANTVFGGHNNGFGSKPQTAASSVFGNTGFGTTTTANTTFGTNTSGGFTNQSFFGKGTSTTTTPSTNNKAFNFNAGSNNTNSGFNPPSFNFGTTNPPGFSDNKQPGFGTTFPSNGFGSNTSTTTSTTTNSTTSIFGAATGGFGGNSSFGGNTSFGGNNNQAPPPFGSSNNNTFNASGSNNNTFGASTTNNNFGTPANTSNFGGFGNGDSTTFPKLPSTGGFGASGDSTFQFGGSNNAAPPVFGAANPINNTSSGLGQVFSFGGSNTTTPANNTSGVFAFGSTDQKSNFSASNNNTSGFGTGGTTFGSNSVPGSFNTTPQFGTPTAGMFSIGTGSSTGPKQRHQLKAKRRT